MIFVSDVHYQLEYLNSIPQNKGPVVILGDLINWNYAYFEVGSVNENQLVGGMFDQNYSVVANTFLVRKSSIQIEEVRSI